MTNKQAKAIFLEQVEKVFRRPEVDNSYWVTVLPGLMKTLGGITDNTKWVKSLDESKRDQIINASLVAWKDRMAASGVTV